MRNEPLTGYILHQKPYGESRSLIYFFSQEFGLVHGIGKKNLPLFMPISLFATGKNSLKTFSQSQLLTHKPLLISQNFGKPMIIGLYLNELLLKILGIANVEEVMPKVWQQYEYSLVQIFRKVNTHQNQRWQFVLRQFETVLLDELGYAIDFSQDFLQQPINPQANYCYRLEQGFVSIVNKSQNIPNNQPLIFGKQLIDWQEYLTKPNIFAERLSQNLLELSDLLRKIGVIYRQVLDNLLNYQTIKSRELWQQLSCYQKHIYQKQIDKK
ncbi:DNA replication and repair protein RecO [Moraxella macacae 0408225]|uniref:DNA repair protein RecO n=1 Tax=Moraxella macacae 0408225 TaxID=1230338 RepID=L2FA72_9GAMM|nr:DNA repair protein RecO C-terminal domain-containing protein [Moraxella macacae]ELA09368.1 DNA replication and repair protein RecO [Moraxella macacae 0408225]